MASISELDISKDSFRLLFELGLLDPLLTIDNFTYNNLRHLEKSCFYARNFNDKSNHSELDSSRETKYLDYIFVNEVTVRELFLNDFLCYNCAKDYLNKFLKLEHEPALLLTLLHLHSKLLEFKLFSSYNTFNSYQYIDKLYKNLLPKITLFKSTGSDISKIHNLVEIEYLRIKNLFEEFRLSVTAFSILSDYLFGFLAHSDEKFIKNSIIDFLLSLNSSQLNRHRLSEFTEKLITSYTQELLEFGSVTYNRFRMMVKNIINSDHFLSIYTSILTRNELITIFGILYDKRRTLEFLPNSYFIFKNSQRRLTAFEEFIFDIFLLKNSESSSIFLLPQLLDSYFSIKSTHLTTSLNQSNFSIISSNIDLTILLDSIKLWTGESGSPFLTLEDSIEILEKL